MKPHATYFLQPREDVAALVPLTVRRVLDVGCGFGALGRFLVAERGCEVHGIERNPEADAYLAGAYARYVIGDVETSVEKFTGERFDCIVFADILEHLVDPWTTLTNYCTFLSPQGVVVASIPNVRNIALLLNLIVRGRWQYTDSGYLDRTHLRFFTRAEIEKLFDGAGLVIERIEVNRDRYRKIYRVLAAIPTLLIPDLAVCQFKILARRR